MSQQKFQDYWGTCFCSLPITFAQSNYLIGRVTTPILFRESWGELLGCPNNYWKKGKILGDCSSTIFLSTLPIWQLDWRFGDCWRCSKKVSLKVCFLKLEIKTFHQYRCLMQPNLLNQPIKTLTLTSNQSNFYEKSNHGN